MSIFTKRIEDINEQDLQELVDQKFAEWKTVEYKESLSVASDSERKRFLSQVSSLANTSGGYLIYGVRAKDGVPLEVCGMEIANPDGEVLRLEDMARSGIRPRIPGVLMRAVTVNTDKVAIVIHVPKSWARPHQVIFNGEYRFYARASNGKYTVDVDELRSLFLLSETAAERIRNFRADRIAQLTAGETPVPMDENAKLVLQVVPLGAFDPGTKFNLASIAGDTNLLVPMRTGGGGWNSARHNFDGIYTHTSHNNLSYSYVQVFRNGIVEMVNTSLLDPSRDNRKSIPSIAYENELRGALRRCLQIEEQLGAEPPFVVMLSLLGVKDYVMAVSPSRRFDQGHPIDRDVLVVPEGLIESVEASPDKVLRPLLDVVWNAAGWPGTINFDEEDNWKPHE